MTNEMDTANPGVFGPRFGILFVVLTLTVAAAPVLPARPVFVEMVRVFVTVTLLVGLFTLSRHRRVFGVGIVLSAAAAVLNWFPVAPVRLWGFLASAGFLVLVASVILRTVLAHSRVTSNTIYGAICVYLLLGLVFAFGFSFLYGVDAHTLRMATNPQSTTLPVERQFSTMLYFSFVTLTTVGYGDVTPVSAVARSLALLEAVLGQLYLVVLIARLVGLQIAHEISSSARR